jgi:hypothetical protein
MNDLNEIRMAIEALPTTSHYEIFNIINKHNISFTENSNGIFINMKKLSKNCLHDLTKHIKWLNEQKDYLQKDELLKQNYKENYF